MSDLHIEFDDEFKNTSVNITVQEMGEILVRNIYDALDVQIDDVEESILRDLLFHIFKEFSANVMADMFPILGSDNTLEIEPRDK
jgi:hypothetical protein